MSTESNVARILKSQGRSLPTHPITIRLLDAADTTRVADAPACLRFVSDRARLEAIDEAAAELAKLATAPDDRRRAAEESYHFLVRAIRVSDAPGTPFFLSALEAKNALTVDEAQRLENEYNRFATLHAAETMAPEKIAEVRKDAETFFVPDLLKRHGYWNVARQLPFLAMKYGASLIPTS